VELLKKLVDNTFEGIKAFLAKPDSSRHRRLRNKSKTAWRVFEDNSQGAGKTLDTFHSHGTPSRSRVRVLEIFNAELKQLGEGNLPPEYGCNVIRDDLGWADM
jgi:hypothetical protein